MRPELSLHPSFRSETVRIGTEQSPVIVIDNFIARPDALVRLAAGGGMFGRVASGYYPGVRAPLPRDYPLALHAHLAALVAETFAQRPAHVQIVEANFSLVTTPPQALARLQRIPHYDSADPNRIAVLHYLCGPEHGGTAFYRHRATGQELMTGAGAGAYMQLVEADIARHGEPPQAYVSGDTPAYERIAAFEAAFNRALIYRGASLHSGLVPESASLSADPRQGRLTANTFLHIV